MPKWKTIAIVATCGLLLAGMTSFIDVIFWRTIDHGQAPIRALVLGDQDYYILRVHAVLLEHQPIESPFFFEHRLGHPRFVVFEWLIAGMGKLLVRVLGTNAIIWDNLLRALAVLALFAEWIYVFRKWTKLKLWQAVALAASVNLWQEAFSMNVQYALGSWFMPFAFGGLLCAAAALRSEVRWKRLAFLFIATLLFSVHPIISAAGCGSVGLALLMRSYRERRLLGFLEASAWGIPSLAFGLFLFGSFLSPAAETAKIVAETLLRNADVPTHLPVQPLALVRALAVTVLAWLALKKTPADDARRPWWQLLFAWCLVTFLLTGSNLVSGRYFLGDHFLFFQRVIAVAAAAIVSGQAFQRPSKRERAIILASAAGLAAYGIGLLVDHPVRSWLTLGYAAPYFIANGFLIWKLLGGAPRLRFTPRLAFLLVAVSALYAFFFLWRLNRRFIPIHQEAQQARPVLEALDRLPPGAVLSDPDLAPLVTAYTPQRPYWTQLAFLDEASNAELLARWRDALMAYPDDPKMADDQAEAGLYGTESNFFCDLLTERYVYAPLKERGILKASLCRRIMTPAQWTAFTAAERAAAEERRLHFGWKPAYRLDYIVIDHAKNEWLPTALVPTTTPVYQDKRFEIFRYRP